MNKENEGVENAKLGVSLLTIQVVAEAIQQLGEVSSDRLYGQFTDTLELHEYQQVIGALKRIGLVTETHGYLLRWSGRESNENQAESD